MTDITTAEFDTDDDGQAATQNGTRTAVRGLTAAKLTEVLARLHHDAVTAHSTYELAMSEAAPQGSGDIVAIEAKARRRQAILAITYLTGQTPGAVRARVEADAAALD